MRKNGQIVKCSYCGEEVYRKLRDIKSGRELFCSSKCYTKGGRIGRIPWNKGMKGEYESDPPNAKKSEVLIDKKGRAWLYIPKHPRSHRGRVLQSRYIVEKHIGRFLDSNEIIHHINYDPSDNRIDNLLITNRSEHARIHKQSKRKV